MFSSTQEFESVILLFKKLHKKPLLFAICGLFFLLSCAAFAEQQAQVSPQAGLPNTLSANALFANPLFEDEPPVIQALLTKALEAENDGIDENSDWHAANYYCEASRYGSAEGQFRLGMLYAVGRGVPQSRDLAAALFATASQQGHAEAQKMLETVALNQRTLPSCVLSAVQAEKAPLPILQSSDSGIDRYIAALPSNKRWVLNLVETIAHWHEVDPKLVLSIISVESDFNHLATSNKEAQGLMQLIPSTAERFNVKNAFSASQNIKGGVAYLRWLLAYFEGDVALSLAAYNAGEGAVNKYHGVPPFQETREYVKKILKRYPHKSHPYDATIVGPSPIIKLGNRKRQS